MLQNCGEISRRKIPAGRGQGGKTTIYTIPKAKVTTISRPNHYGAGRVVQSRLPAIIRSLITSQDITGKVHVTTDYVNLPSYNVGYRRAKTTA